MFFFLFPHTKKPQSTTVYCLDFAVRNTNFQYCCSRCCKNISWNISKNNPWPCLLCAVMLLMPCVWLVELSIFGVHLEKTNKILKYLCSEMFLFLLLCSNYPFISACLDCAGCFVHTLSACWNATCDAGIDFGWNLCLTDLTGFMCAPVCKIHNSRTEKSDVFVCVYCIFNEWSLAMFDLCNHLQDIGRLL